MAKQRRAYTPEFKAEAVKLVTEKGQSVAEAARSLGIGETLPRSWKDALHKSPEQPFPGQGNRTALDEEMRRLQAENKRLQAERDIFKNAGLLRPGGAVTFAFIEDHQEEWPVAVLCDALDVSASGFYAWLARPVSAAGRRYEALLVGIRAVHSEVKGRYGSPRIHAELAAREVECCRNTVAKLVADNDIRAKTARKFRNTTDSNHRLPVSANVLDRPFGPAGPDEK